MSGGVGGYLEDAFLDFPVGDGAVGVLFVRFLI